MEVAEAAAAVVGSAVLDLPPLLLLLLPLSKPGDCFAVLPVAEELRAVAAATTLGCCAIVCAGGGGELVVGGGCCLLLALRVLTSPTFAVDVVEERANNAARRKLTVRGPRNSIGI